jgi:1-acyl-sn-glycerol-3-phosphate acyltransferase
LLSKGVGKGIPSVSYNLRHGGSALIDRKIPNKPFLKSKLGDYIEEHNRSAVIFPEGTRVKANQKSFHKLD